MLPYAVQHVTVQNDGTQVQQTTFDYPFFYTILFFFFFPKYLPRLSCMQFLYKFQFRSRYMLVNVL